MDYAIQTPLQLSSHLRALRKARGLSQAALGRILGVGQTRVARIEGDPTAVSVDQLLEVLAALNVRLVRRHDDTPVDAEPATAAAPARTRTPARTPTKKATKRRPADGDW